MNCWITLRSLDRLYQIPEVADCRLLGLLSRDRRRYYLSWNKCHVTPILLEDGRVELRLILANFSDDVDSLNVKNSVFPEEVTSSFIKTSSIVDVYYLVALTKEDFDRGKFLAMEVLSLEVSEDGVVFQFPLQKFRERHWDKKKDILYNNIRL